MSDQTVRDFLTRWYGAKILSKEPPEGVQADFQAALADPDFRADAVAQLRTYPQEVLDRCFMSRVFQGFLNAQLNS